MKTLQEKYNAILEGNFSKTQFVRDARLAHSNLITQFNSFADTVAILKNKGMVVEAKKAEVTAYKKPEVDPIDMVAPDLLDHGIEAELHAAGITGTPSEEEYAKAKEKAAKELIKDPLCYKNAQTMTEPGEKMEKAKLNEGSKENHQRTSLIDKFAQPEIAAAAAEKPFKVSRAFRDMAVKPENREKYLKMSPQELYAAAKELEETNENEKEYKEGDGADKREMEKHATEFYVSGNSLKKSGKIYFNQKLKDFTALGNGETTEKYPEIKKQLFPAWKKEDFKKLIKDLKPVEITESLSAEAHTRNENEEEGSGYSYGEYKEGNGATPEEIQGRIDFYQKKPDVWSMVAKKDFEAMANGKSADIKDEYYPEWKKEDFVKVLNAFEPVEITERLSAEAHTRMEGSLNTETVNTFIEAAGVMIKELKKENFEEDDIFEFLIDRLLTLESMSSADEIDKDEKQFRREQGLEEQETQLKEAVKTLIKKTLES